MELYDAFQSAVIIFLLYRVSRLEIQIKSKKDSE
jgi:hypothetical protein